MFRTMAMLMGPEVGAGGGGAGAGGTGGGAGAGGAAGAGAGGAGAGAGAKGGAGAGAGAGTGAGAGAKGAGAAGSSATSEAAAAGMTLAEFEEWEDGGRKFKVPRAALRTAFQREGAVSNKARELTEREKRIDVADAEREEFEGLLEKGDLDKLLHGRFKGDKVALAAKWFKAVVDQENKLADPAQRELLEKAGEVDRLRKENDGFKQAEARKLADAEITKRLQGLSDRYMPALDKLGLPKNDITIALMRGEDRTNQRLGLNLSPEALAESTRGALVELVDEGLTKEMTPAQAVVAFPKLARLLHKGLIEQELGRRNGTIAKPVVNTKRAAANGQKNGESEGDVDGKPKFMNHAEIQKKTGIWGL